jgi:chromosomal replication initiation ATPase DnaA
MIPVTDAATWSEVAPETMRGILAVVCERHGVSVDELKGRSKRKRLTRPRQEANWRMVQTGRWSLPRIGMFMRRHHTTILHGCLAFERRLASGEAKL